MRRSVRIRRRIRHVRRLRFDHCPTRPASAPDGWRAGRRWAVLLPPPAPPLPFRVLFDVLVAIPPILVLILVYDIARVVVVVVATVDAGHFKMNATVVAMRLSACLPIPNMLTKTFHQWESRLCGGGTSNCRSNTLVHDDFASFWARVATESVS
jgi:hypothetical protein